MVLFLFCAILGWIKLRHGFNFIDEGYHMAESWRLSVGDNIIKDKLTDILLLYTLINAQIFKIFPNISLLEFRRIQYFLSIISIVFLSFSLSKYNNKYWYLPLIFSIFAFTGLDPIGMISNLNYYTYPHLFITIFISAFLLGLQSKSLSLKRMLFLFSGSSD